ncbi:unnamed protein product [Cyclocybe aegerita]|uniref:Uncharacterized protein n=1 Tax=Cyclocybe aegerita TaxID=1973307 RepID=A0A8S0WJB1_CYCAE|nr:unnamed protein product [Cyclocybe aegerita]
MAQSSENPPRSSRRAAKPQRLRPHRIHDMSVAITYKQLHGRIMTSTEHGGSGVVRTLESMMITAGRQWGSARCSEKDAKKHGVPGDASLSESLRIGGTSI